MKRYTVTDNKTGLSNTYGTIAWNFAFGFIYLMGIITGILLTFYLK